MGWWQCVSSYNNKCNFFPPSYSGENEGDTAVTSCSKNDATQMQWVWHLGKPENRDSGTYYGSQPHVTTDVNTRCPCLIFADHFNCQSSLGAWWQVKQGSFTLAADTPLFYGTAYWENDMDGRGWYITNNNCLFNCNPVAPTYVPIAGTDNPPLFQTTGCSAPTTNPNQARWKWDKFNQQWNLDFGSSTWIVSDIYWTMNCNNCFPNCDPVQPIVAPTWNTITNNWNTITTPCVSTIGGYCFPGAWVYQDSEYPTQTDWEPNSQPCQPLKPTFKGTTDGQIAYTACPVTNHAILGSNTIANLSYGKIKNQDLLVCLEVSNPGVSDEVRIYFDTNKYAYFKFSSVDNGNYTTVGGYPQFLPDDRAEEGQIGIFDGNNRIGHNSISCAAYDNAGYWLALWIRLSEDGQRQVASAILGQNSRMDNTSRGPGWVIDVASAYVSVLGFNSLTESQYDQIYSGEFDSMQEQGSEVTIQLGIGSGQITSGRTLIDRVSVSEAARSWVLQWADSGQLSPTDCTYSMNSLPSYADYYASCWATGIDNACCMDGIPASEITVSVVGIQNGQNSNNLNPNYSDPPCLSCTSINGTYVLTRNDECWEAGCDGYAYVYIGSCGCGSFTIGLEFYSGILGQQGIGNFGVEICIDPCIPPIYQNCDDSGIISTYGQYQPIAPTGTNGRMDCLGSDLIGASITLSNWGWGNTYLNSYNCFNGTITITSVQ
jgi:hypothetical protein